MSPEEALAVAFDEQRPRLVSVAFRLLGSQTDAEDVVQEAWLRLARQEAGAIENLAGWLTTVVGRICIDLLRSRTAKPETAYGDQLPEFVVTADDELPEDAAVLADSIGVALLVVLDALRPEERLAFVLHDLFGLPFAQIGAILGKSADATKMLASRARRKVQRTATPPGARAQQREVVDAFLAAARDGDFERLMQVLDPDVVWHTHTPRGAEVKTGSTEIVAALRRAGRADHVATRVLVDGEPGILVRDSRGRPLSVMACTVSHGRIVEMVSLLDPGRLAGTDLPGTETPLPG